MSAHFLGEILALVISPTSEDVLEIRTKRDRTGDD